MHRIYRCGDRCCGKGRTAQKHVAAAQRPILGSGLNPIFCRAHGLSFLGCPIARRFGGILKERARPYICLWEKYFGWLTCSRLELMGRCEARAPVLTEAIIP